MQVTQHPVADRTRAPVAGARERLRVGGLVPLTTTDYPGQLAAVVFCQGCPWRCGYCHNPHLLPARRAMPIAWHAVRDFLERRRGLLDAVVFSGGEPTLQPGVAEAVTEVKALGFRIGLHTAGIYPARLARLLPLVDWVGMDVKAPFGDYDAITGAAGSGARALASTRLILASGVDCEFRTTVHNALLSREMIVALADMLAALGVRRYALQGFRSEGCVSPALASVPQAGFLDPGLRRELAGKFETFVLRPA